MDQQPKIYFLGSGPIAVPAVATLAASSVVKLVGIGTQPDRPAGRKRQLTPTSVRHWALEQGRDTDQLASVNTPETTARLQALDPDFILVVSFSQILKSQVLSLPRSDCVNIHASLLPRYRGASPVSSALLNQDQQTGITFMSMDEGLDTGQIYCSYEYPIPYDAKADAVEEALGNLAAVHVEEVLAKIAEGQLQAAEQNHELATVTTKVKKSDGFIDWTMPAATILAKLKAYHPWPGISFHLHLPKRETVIRITDAEILTDKPGQSGEVVAADREHWAIACGENALLLKQVIPQGKREMSGAEFLRGHSVPLGTIIKNQL